MRAGIDRDGLTRRILISYLIGRPMSEVAHRAGCGVRFAYKTIRDLLFDREPRAVLLQWIELGLLAVVDTPDQVVEGFDEPEDCFGYTVDSSDAHVFCLICHRYITTVPIDERRHDSRIFDQVDELLDAAHRERRRLASVQAHLILHFRLGYDPIPKRDTSLRDSLLRGYQETGNSNLAVAAWLMQQNLPPKRISWTAHIDMDVFTRVDSARLSEEHLTPLVNGQPLSVTLARERWNRMLRNPGR